MVNYRSKLEAYWPHDQRRSGRTLQWYQSGSLQRKLSEKEYYQGNSKGKKKKESEDDQQNQSNGTAVNQSNTAQPEVALKYPEFIHFNTDGILKGIDQGSWDDFWLKSELVRVEKKDEMARVGIHMRDRLIECMGGYHQCTFFGQEFGAIAEILGLTRNDGDDVKKVYMVYLDVFVSYYKTARAPQAPAEAVEDSSLESYQWSVGKNGAPSTSQKGKEKIEHFGIKHVHPMRCVS
ncbi:hypothetical protein Tco_0717673 [Tanacetum coccineum]